MHWPQIFSRNQQLAASRKELGVSYSMSGQHGASPISVFSKGDDCREETCEMSLENSLHNEIDRIVSLDQFLKLNTQKRTRQTDDGFDFKDDETVKTGSDSRRWNSEEDYVVDERPRKKRVTMGFSVMNLLREGVNTIE